MANDDVKEPEDGTTEQPKSGQMQETQMTLGVDWDSGNVIINTQIDGKPISIGIPVHHFVSSGVAIGMQMLERLKASQNSGIVIAHPGQLPPGLKLH